MSAVEGNVVQAEADERRRLMEYLRQQREVFHQLWDGAPKGSRPVHLTATEMQALIEALTPRVDTPVVGAVQAPQDLRGPMYDAIYRVLGDDPVLLGPILEGALTVALWWARSRGVQTG